MTKNIINARVTFRKSPIHVLERFSLGDSENAYRSFKEHTNLSECVILQTCNRVEIFGSAENFDKEKIKKTWASLAGLEESTFHENLEWSEDSEVYEHLLKLTSGLDSMVVGEEQIMTQIKDSIQSAKKLKVSGESLNTLFDNCLLYTSPSPRD